MNTEKIKEFVNNSELPQLQKNVMNGFIDRAKEEQERQREDRQLIEQVANVMHPADGEKFIDLLYKEYGYCAMQNLMDYRGMKLLRSFDVEEGCWSVY